MTVSPEAEIGDPPGSSAARSSTLDKPASPEQGAPSPARGVPGARAARMRTSRQDDLFDALVEIFLAEGFSQFTLADLAARLRCSKSTLYALAHSKEQLAVAVVAHFFRVAAERIEAAVAQVGDPREQLSRYLGGVARELRPASPAFRADLAAHPVARAEYERNTRIAAARIRALVAAGIEAGAFRAAHAGFVGQAATAVMVAIQQGAVAEATGLSDADAYAELAGLLLHGLSEAPQPPPDRR